jgi:hypothetical protein
MVGGYYRKTTTTTTVTLDPADSYNPRKDIIIVDSNGTITKVTGTPEPADPPDQTGVKTRRPKPPSIPANSIILAEIWVPAGATQITDTNITDRRVFIDRYRKTKIICVDDFAGTDLEKFQAAIAEADSVNGSIILVPSQYTIAGTINVNKSKLCFIGYPKVSSITQTSTDTPTMAIAADDIFVYGIKFVGKGDGSTLDIGIYQSSSTQKNLKVVQCEFTNANIAIYIAGNNNLISENHIHDLVGTNNCGIRVLGDNNQILGNQIINTADGMNIQDSTNYADNNIIANNFLKGQTSNGISVLYGVHNKVVNNTIIDHSGTTGIDISWGANETLVEGNTIITTGTYGIDLDAEKIEAANNHIIQNKSDGTGIGIWIQGGKRCHVHNNVIVGSGLANAIKISTAEPAFNNIHHNWFGDTTSYTIYIDNSACQQNIIWNNKFKWSDVNQYYKTNALWNYFLQNLDESSGSHIVERAVIITWVASKQTITGPGSVDVYSMIVPPYTECLVLASWGKSDATASGQCYVELYDATAGQAVYSHDLFTPQLKIGNPVTLTPLYHSVQTWSAQKEIRLRLRVAVSASKTLEGGLVLMLIHTGTM